eukprot:SAG22_NODE_174_length_16466_cov_34.991568_2_plen_159_part_00
MDTERMAIAEQQAARLGVGGQLAAQVCEVNAGLGVVATPAGQVLPGAGGAQGGYDTIIAACSIRVMANPPAHYAVGDGEPAGARAGVATTVAGRYRNLFGLCLRSLAPGGHLLIGDHTGAMGVFDQLQLIAEAGFVDVDVAWRKRDWFVIGGRKAADS